MRRGTLILLLFIILLAAGASYVVFWPNPDANGKPWHRIPNPFTFSYGIDLQGGLQVLLVPKAGQNVTSDAIQTTANVLGSRINGLGLKEPVIRVLTTDNKESIEVDLPHFSGNEEETVNNLLKSGVLEFWITGSAPPQENQTLDLTQYAQYNPGNKPAFTGTDLDVNSLGIQQQDTGGGYQINFAMNSNKATDFGTFTSNHIGQYMTITLDRVVVNSAVIQSVIPGNGRITGNFTRTTAQGIVNTLKYGALPVALQKDSENTLQATLGSDTIKKSILAGIIGISIVALFMLLYYRLPGFLADIALALYTILTLAIFKAIGATLTLAGIAGLVLSVGMAVDANVLIFERVKEELRSGRVLASAIDMGWKRAWPSIRDSNISTLITCGVLYFFGSNFGATMITGFATTLALGVLVSMFTAIVVTRTLLNLLVPTGVINHPALFGLPAGSIAKDKVSLASRNATA